MKKLNILRLSALLTLAACAGFRPPVRDPGSVAPTDADAPSSVEVAPPSGAGAPNYELIFKRARESLITQEASKERLKKVPENQFVDFLQTHPEYLNEEQSKLIAAVEAESKTHTDLTKHTRLVPPAGKPGYSDVKVYVNHPYFIDGRPVPKDNMLAAWTQFLKSARKEIILNVFDFDLVSVAEVLVQKARSGVKVQVGIDKGVIDTRPEVKKVYDLLKAGGVSVTAVNSVGLNHQKVTAIDWSDKEAAAVLFSSGNLTKSCIEPDGDLKGISPLPDVSVPNANHLITMKSWILSNLIKHELTKTIDEKFLLRGRQYPINGSYQVTGPGVDPYVLEAYPEPSIIITFSPNGGLKNINKNLIANILKREKGPIRMIQFAFSSEDVEQALLFRAQQDIQQTGKFDFISVGDTPFNMREWSRFLIMSGLKLDITPTSKTYSDDVNGAWWKGIGADQIQILRKKIYNAPPVYGEHHLKIGGQAMKANGKIHHKILATPNFAIMGTSFNFSKGAESNNEQLLIFRDRKMSKIVEGMLKHLVNGSKGTVSSEALRRNTMRNFKENSDAVEDKAAN